MTPDRILCIQTIVNLKNKVYVTQEIYLDNVYATKQNDKIIMFVRLNKYDRAKMCMCGKKTHECTGETDCKKIGLSSW